MRGYEIFGVLHLNGLDDGNWSLFNAWLTAKVSYIISHSTLLVLLLFFHRLLFRSSISTTTSMPNDDDMVFFVCWLLATAIYTLNTSRRTFGLNLNNHFSSSYRDSILYQKWTQMTANHPIPGKTTTKQDKASLFVEWGQRRKCQRNAERNSAGKMVKCWV